MAAHDPPPDSPAWDETADSGGYELYYDEPLDADHDASGTVNPAHLARAASDAWMHLDHDHPSWLARLWWEARWIIYLAAFVLPLLILIAFLLLLNALGLSGNNRDDAATSRPTLAATHPPADLPTQVHTLPPNPEWPATVTFVSHSTPARIRNTFYAGQHGYAFWGEVGHVWSISAEPYGDSLFDPNMTFYDPAGKRICIADDCITGAARTQIAYTIPESGIYRVVVESASGTGTGAYLLTLDVE